MPLAQLFPTLEALAETALKSLPLALLVLLGAFAAQFILDRALALLAARTSLEPADLGPLRKTLRGVLWLIATVLVLTVFGVHLGGLWAVLSTILAMVGIGFVAVWSLLSNVSSTLIILFFRPFAIGDELEFTGEPVKGRVVDINFLYTTLQTDDDALIQIPNNLFFQKSLKRRRCHATVSLAHQLNRPEPARV